MANFKNMNDPSEAVRKRAMMFRSKLEQKIDFSGINRGSLCENRFSFNREN
jgi:hypothetical protein